MEMNKEAAWISTHDSLPKDGERVLLNDYLNSYWYKSNLKVFTNGVLDIPIDTVAYWLRIPEVPK